MRERMSFKAKFTHALALLSLFCSALATGGGLAVIAHLVQGGGR